MLCRAGVIVCMAVIVADTESLTVSASNHPEDVTLSPVQQGSSGGIKQQRKGHGEDSGEQNRSTDQPIARKATARSSRVLDEQRHGDGEVYRVARALDRDDL